MTFLRHGFWAGILAIPALALSVAPNSEGDSLTTPILNYLVSAPWTESRRYDGLPDDQRRATVEHDLAFDRWLAHEAVRNGIQLDPSDQPALEQTRTQLIHYAASLRIQQSIRPTRDEIQRFLPQWSQPLPELWEVFYIFIDTTQARTDSERERLHARAIELRQQATPENFQLLAQLWSDAASSADRGSMGAITLEGLGPTFASNVRSTPPGTIGGPYPTQSGWNIIYLRSHQPQRPRSYTPDQLEQMAREVLAAIQLQEYHKDPQKWGEFLASSGAFDDPIVQQGVEAHRNALLAQRFVQSRIDALPAPTDEELRALYTSHSDSFRLGPRRKAREIFLTADNWSTGTSREDWYARRAVRDRARNLRQRILDGDDFAALARELSAAPTASHGGDLGWIQEPSDYLIDSTLAPLMVGDVSPPVALDNGYLLLQLTDIEPSPQIPFDDAREECRRLWTQQRREALLQDLRVQFGPDVQK